MGIERRGIGGCGEGSESGRPGLVGVERKQDSSLCYISQLNESVQKSELSD